MLYIPKKIKVGYQNRENTYTGKLGYVIYLGKDKKWKKEPSWNGWRHKEIDPTEFDNVPMEGFVLNKKAGDYKSRWGGRKAHFRIYDPRGFEFEIDVDNLLFILENVSSSPGKALDGKFVYSWNSGDIFLLPTNCLDFPYIQEFSEMDEKKINLKKLKIGSEYFSKTNGWCLFLGEFKITLDNRWYYLSCPNEISKVFRAQDGSYFYDNKPSFVQEREFSGDLSTVLTDFIENSALTDIPESITISDVDVKYHYFLTDGKSVYKRPYWYQNEKHYTKLVVQNDTLEHVEDPEINPESLVELTKDVIIKTKKGKEYSYYGRR